MDYFTLYEKIQKHGSGIRKFCESHDRIWIYGSGRVGQLFLKYLRIGKMNINGFIESDGFFTDHVEEYCTYRLSEILPELQNDGIIICVRKESVETVYWNCINAGIEAENILIQHLIDPGVDIFNTKSAFLNSKQKLGIGYFGTYSELERIGAKCGTDKAHEYNNYLTKYEFFLIPYRNKKIILIELGVLNGCSLKMWEEFFPNAQIVGVDINPECERYNSERKRVLIKDLADIDELISLCQFHPDLIIDDASHIWSHQIMALSVLLPAVASGGLYILEDLATSFELFKGVGWYEDTNISPYDFLTAIAEVVTSNEHFRKERGLFVQAQLSEEIEELAGMIEMISFVGGSCIIVRK